MALFCPHCGSFGTTKLEGEAHRYTTAAKRVQHMLGITYKTAGA
jgi:hypothetical protein